MKKELGDFTIALFIQKVLYHVHIQAIFRSIKMTANEIINKALKYVMEPIVKEHIQETDRRTSHQDTSLQRERLSEIPSNPLPLESNK